MRSGREKHAAREASRSACPSACALYGERKRLCAQSHGGRAAGGHPILPRALPSNGRGVCCGAGTGQRQARRLAAETCRLWCSVCHAPTWGSLSLHDTLRSIGRGFRQYDVRFFAHRFPCEIDYQPAIPVSETQKGLSYVNLYLRRPAAGRCGISCALCPRDRCAGRSAAGLRRSAGTICLTRRVLTSSSRSLRGRQETIRHSLRRR